MTGDQTEEAPPLEKHDKVGEKAIEDSEESVNEVHDTEKAPANPEPENDKLEPLTRTSTRASTIDPATEPPDGGLNAWLKVLGCFLIYSNIWSV